MPSINHNESKEPGLRMLPAASPFSLDVLWTTPNIRLLMCITPQESSVEQIISHVCPTYWYHLGFVGQLDF